MLRVVLVNTRNPLNIGAAARAMSNFGVLSLRLVNPFEPSFREAKSAVGAAPVLQDAEVFASLAEAVADCTLVVGTSALEARNPELQAKSLQEAGDEISAKMRSGNVALVFGSEKRGLSNDDLNHCHFVTRIPTREEHGSMNLGQAVAVCLYEIARRGSSQPSLIAAPVLADAAILERINESLLEALKQSGYLKPSTAQNTRDNVRRLTRRLNLSAEDAELLLGMLRKIARKP